MIFWTSQLKMASLQMSKFSVLKNLDGETNQKKCPIDPVKRLIFGVKTRDLSLIKSAFDEKQECVWVEIDSSLPYFERENIGKCGMMAKKYFDEKYKNTLDAMIDNHNDNHRESYMMVESSDFNLLYLPFLLFDQKTAEKFCTEILSVTVDKYRWYDQIDRKKYSAIFFHKISKEIFADDYDNDWDTLWSMQYHTDKRCQTYTLRGPASFYDWSSDDDEDESG